MKDVAACEKLRVAGKQAISGDVRMGKPNHFGGYHYLNP
jgi:hypothetical protein